MQPNIFLEFSTFNPILLQGQSNNFLRRCEALIQMYFFLKVSFLNMNFTDYCLFKMTARSFNSVCQKACFNSIHLLVFVINLPHFHLSGDLQIPFPHLHFLSLFIAIVSKSVQSEKMSILIINNGLFHSFE